MKLVKFLILALLTSITCANSQQYTYKNWGLNDQTGSNVQAVDAWSIETGSKQVVVAVIDTGIDSNHEDLKPNLWHDPNNYSVYGWDFVNNNSNPIDINGHGSHVAGIIGAISDTKAGISGVVRNVSIMSVKYYSDSNPGTINLRNTVRAINYAVDHGARIINYSGGGPEYSEDEYNAIKRAESKGILFVCAAGNGRENTDMKKNAYYPSAYRLSNIISVAATDRADALIPSSNWGEHTVDVTAPGENIYSTLPNSKFGYMSGTSQATAFVTGIAALVLSRHPQFNALEIKETIVLSVDKFPQLKNRVISGGRVNAYSAISR